MKAVTKKTRKQAPTRKRMEKRLTIQHERWKNARWNDIQHKKERPRLSADKKWEVESRTKRIEANKAKVEILPSLFFSHSSFSFPNSLESFLPRTALYKKSNSKKTWWTLQCYACSGCSETKRIRRQMILKENWCENGANWNALSSRCTLGSWTPLYCSSSSCRTFCLLWPSKLFSRLKIVSWKAVSLSWNTLGSPRSSWKWTAVWIALRKWETSHNSSVKWLLRWDRHASETPPNKSRKK